MCGTSVLTQEDEARASQFKASVDYNMTVSMTSNRNIWTYANLVTRLIFQMSCAACMVIDIVARHLGLCEKDPVS